MKFVYSFLLSALISLNAFSQVPSIVSFTPNNGYVGTQVELTGSGFSSDISKNVVWIGGVKCPVISANPSSLVIEIPLHASRDCFLYTNTETNQSCYSKEKFIVRFNSSKGYNYTSGSFGEAVNFTLGAIGSPFNAKKFNLSDIDEDGKLDIVAFNDYSTVTFFLNNATPGTINSSTFVSSSQTVLTTDQYFRHTVISDWDSDGKLDYMAGLPGYAGSSLYKNTSTVGSPSLVHSYNTPTSYTFMPAPFDANRDGKIDIICLYDVHDRVYYLENTNSNPSDNFTFNAWNVNHAKGMSWSTLRNCDLDNDGKQDLIAGAGSGTAHIAILKNNTTDDAAASAFSFSAPTLYEVAGGRVVDIQVVNLDGDPYEDIVTASNYSPILHIFRNTSSAGDITFATRMDINLGQGNISGIASADMNNDGKIDIVVSTANRLILLLNTTESVGNVTFADPINLTSSGASLFSLELADIDGDGLTDIIGVPLTGGSIKVFQNLLELESLPLIWSDFSAVAQESGISLSWKTEQEEQVSKFELEFSTDGTRFEKFHTIPAKNQAFNQYQALHIPDAVGKLFYRIKQIDIDGRFTYSPVKVVNFAGRSVVKIYPNPLTEKLIIQIAGGLEKSSVISVFDISGKELTRVKIESGQNQFTINSSGWSSGMYWLKIFGSDGRIVHQEKLIKK